MVMATDLKIALPKGRLAYGTESLLLEAGLGLDAYREGSRLYRFQSSTFPCLKAKVFNEKDVPIQVAVGNYDLGISGLDWVSELIVKYPASPLVRLMNLNYGKTGIFAAVSASGGIPSMTGWHTIVSEYPNLAESYASSKRIRRFKVLPVWGGVEVYPPENADVVVMSRQNQMEIEAENLQPVHQLLSSAAVLVANRDSWKQKEMGRIVGCIRKAAARVSEEEGKSFIPQRDKASTQQAPEKDSIWLALPDGHQKPQTVEMLSRTDIGVSDYSEGTTSRRPTFEIPWLRAKVIRPQDMPLQVANGNFHLAITGRDWLRDHLTRFPSSPVVEVMPYSYGVVKVAAVVSQTLPVDSIHELRNLFRKGNYSPIRVASEYVNIADRYVLENHLGPYRIIPTWGATEGFLPDDADLLIENSQTGTTLARNKLKIIDELLQSSACLVRCTNSQISPVQEKRLKLVIEMLRKSSLGG